MEAEPLGSAGALVQNLDALPEHFFVLYGDVMAAVDLPRMAQFHLDRQADFTCLAHPNDHPPDLDLLEVADDGRLTAIHAYPHPPGRDFANLVNAALYVVRREALRPWSGAGKTLDFTKDILKGLLAADARVFATGRPIMQETWEPRNGFVKSTQIGGPARSTLRIQTAGGRRYFSTATARSMSRKAACAGRRNWNSSQASRKRLSRCGTRDFASSS